MPCLHGESDLHTEREGEGEGGREREREREREGERDRERRGREGKNETKRERESHQVIKVTPLKPLASFRLRFVDSATKVTFRVN